MTYNRPPKALLWPLTEQDEWPVKDGLAAKDCLAISLESPNVYTLRGVSGWECSAEILWEKGRYTLPHGSSWMSSVDTLQNNAAATPSPMKNVLLSAAGAQVAPQSCTNTLHFHSVFFFFSRLTTRSANNYTSHVMNFISRGLSLHTTIFDFIVRKGVPLIMVIQWTITGVKFPSVPCEPQIACPPQREP